MVIVTFNSSGRVQVFKDIMYLVQISASIQSMNCSYVFYVYTFHSTEVYCLPADVGGVDTVISDGVVVSIVFVVGVSGVTVVSTGSGSVVVSVISVVAVSGVMVVATISGGMVYIISGVKFNNKLFAHQRLS